MSAEFDKQISKNRNFKARGGRIFTNCRGIVDLSETLPSTSDHIDVNGILEEIKKAEQSQHFSRLNHHPLGSRRKRGSY